MKADDIYRALQRRHQLPEWVLVRELRIGTGWGEIDWSAWARTGGKRPRYQAQQRIDAWTLNCYESEHFTRIGYEIKVNKSDFRAEKRDPEKRKPAMAVCDFFYFAAPRGLIAPMDVPKDCGLVVVYDSGRSEILKRAPRLEAKPPDWSFVASLLRNVTRAQFTDLPLDRDAW